MQVGARSTKVFYKVLGSFVTQTKYPRLCVVLSFLSESTVNYIEDWLLSVELYGVVVSKPPAVHVPKTTCCGCGQENVDVVVLLSVYSPHQLISAVCVAVGPLLADLSSTPATALAASSTSTKSGKKVHWIYCTCITHMRLYNFPLLSVQPGAVAQT